jgi:hypothetical protein
VAAWAVTAVEKNVWGVRGEGASRGEGVEGGRPKVNRWDCLTFTIFSSRDKTTKNNISGWARAQKIFAGFKISAHARPVRFADGSGPGQYTTSLPTPVQ